MAECNVVEQNEVPMNLTHIADMRNNRQSEFARQQTYGEEFGNAGQARTVCLYKVDSTGLYEILEGHTIGQMFSER